LAASTINKVRRIAVASERVKSGARLAVLSAALLLVVSACEEQGTGETEQGAAPTTEDPTAATEGEQQ
jgi:hypothetical protein